MLTHAMLLQMLNEAEARRDDAALPADVRERSGETASLCRQRMGSNLNMPHLCDAHLRDVGRQEQERRWRADHVGFVAGYNASVEAEGLPLDAWRTF